MIPRTTLGRLVLTLPFVLTPFASHADDWKSVDAIRGLVARIDAQGGEALAVRDPEQPDRFIAALKLPGQLLVVSAVHPAADLLQDRLDRGEYRQIYMDLQATPAQDTKFFVHDLGSDGLGLRGRGEAFDMVYDGAATLACNGKWKDAKLKEDEYRSRVADADVRYARMLTLLSAPPATTTAVSR